MHNEMDLGRMVVEILFGCMLHAESEFHSFSLMTDLNRLHCESKGHQLKLHW